MKVLKWVLIAVVLIVVAMTVSSFFMTNHYDVSRTVVIDAPQAKVHELVAELKNWEKWQPFTEMDETIKTTLGDKTTGIGAHQSWTGESGDGELTFTKCDPESGIAYDMTMNQGEYKSVGAISYVAKDGKVEVTWSFEGDMDMPVLGPWLVATMDRNVGPMFQNGLDKMKAVAEAK